MRFLSAVCTSLLFVATAAAQTYTLNGKVEDVPGTVNQFFLDGTRIPVVSTVLNLNAWVGTQASLDVVNIGTASAPILRVDAAAPTAKVMDMGNLRLGQTQTWEVFAPAGTGAFIFMDWTDNTGFRPIPGFSGVYLLGLSPHFLTGGITNAAGVFQTTFTTPNNPTLVGLEVTSQALYVPGGVWTFSNVDAKTIQP